MGTRLVETISVLSHGPLRAAAFVWLAGDGRRALTVICKATYELCPGVSPLAQVQEEIHTDERRQAGAPSDLVPFKRRADILVIGHAYAPDGLPVRSLVARVTVGSMSKTLIVPGDRSSLP